MIGSKHKVVSSRQILFIQVYKWITKSVKGTHAFNVAMTTVHSYENQREENVVNDTTVKGTIINRK